MAKQSYTSIANYAKLCNVSKQAIYNRIASGEIETFELPTYSGQLIDIIKHPPQGEKTRGRKAFNGC